MELLYLDGTPGFDTPDVQKRVQMVRAKGAKVALRVDWARGQALPPEGDDTTARSYAQLCQNIAADSILRDCDWLICGNEPNLSSENAHLGSPMEASWVARVVYGHTLDGADTGNVYQFVRTVNPSMQVLLPAVAPYSPEVAGGRQMPAPIDGRSAWAPWESYQYDMWASAYDNSWHADLGEIKGALHTYGAMGIAGIGPGEPFTDQREETYGAQFGTRWLQDAQYLAQQAQEEVYGSGWWPWTLVSECNIYRPPQTPEDDYPAGWWLQAAQYVSGLPNIMGLAAFVDQDYGGNWSMTAMTSGLGRCPAWNTDHDALLSNGW